MSKPKVIETPEQRRRRWTRAVPLLAVLALLFASAGYLPRPAWYDEVITLDWLYYPLTVIPLKYNIPNNHIVYTMCLSMWQSVLGWFGLGGVTYLRILSLLFGALTVLLLSKRFLRAGGFVPALSVLLLLCGSGAFRLFSTALRGYMPGLFFSFAAFLFAERWMRKEKSPGNFLMFALAAYLAAGTIPTDLFAVGGGVLFLGGSAFRSRRNFLRVTVLFLTAFAAMWAFYLPILEKFLKASKLVEGWYGWKDAYFNLYGAFAVFFLPLLIPAAAGAVRLWRKDSRVRLRLCCFALLFLAPVYLGLVFRAPPFPRVFFPFYGVWGLALAYLVSGFSNGKVSAVRKWLPLVLSAAWMLVLTYCSPEISNAMFGSHQHDDMVLAYPLADEFVPHKVGTMLGAVYAKGELPPVFIDFDSDPPSVKFAAMNCGVPESLILYDRPDFGPVVQVPAETWIICSGAKRLEAVRKRFGLTGPCRFANPGFPSIQKIYIPE